LKKGGTEATDGLTQGKTVKLAHKSPAFRKKNLFVGRGLGREWYNKWRENEKSNGSRKETRKKKKERRKGDPGKQNWAKV